MTSSYVAYIDESGCEGFKFLPNEQGSSRWFVLSALVFRKEDDLVAVQLARQARELLKKQPKQALHFRELKHEQRVPFARLIGTSNAWSVSILIHKPSIREPETFQQRKYSLYRYATGLLAERISWLCRDNRMIGKGDGRVEMIYSNRSAMSYDDLRDYLNGMRKDNAVGNRIDWNVIDTTLVRAENHDQLAGLQLADALASGVFFALNKNQYGEVEERYLRLLSATIYRHGATIEEYGLKFWCDDQEQIDGILRIVDSRSE
ncbi:MAG: DUF3800 domain-containing protein [Gammaproteobacteria bacterium]|nr:DUF3800 domain-containing protein [Gammaproteobacteria bacterium]MDP2348212.1 DUF3800 domain-containing protein [Gammaproteobacteria bacterium]